MVILYVQNTLWYTMETNLYPEINNLLTQIKTYTDSSKYLER